MIFVLTSNNLYDLKGFLMKFVLMIGDFAGRTQLCVGPASMFYDEKIQIKVFGRFAWDRHYDV